MYANPALSVLSIPLSVLWCLLPHLLSLTSWLCSHLSARLQATCLTLFLPRSSLLSLPSLNLFYTRCVEWCNFQGHILAWDHQTYPSHYIIFHNIWYLRHKHSVIPLRFMIKRQEPYFTPVNPDLKKLAQPITVLIIAQESEQGFL